MWVITISLSSSISHRERGGTVFKFYFLIWKVKKRPIFGINFCVCRNSFVIIKFGWKYVSNYNRVSLTYILWKVGQCDLHFMKSRSLCKDYFQGIISFTNWLRVMELKWSNVHKIRMCHISKVGHSDLLFCLGSILAQIPSRSVFLLLFNPETWNLGGG